jgi:hypothetical protein
VKKYTDTELVELKSRALFAQSNSINLSFATEHVLNLLAEVQDHRNAKCCLEAPPQKVEVTPLPSREEVKIEVATPESPKEEEISTLEVKAPTKEEAEEALKKAEGKPEDQPESKPEDQPEGKPEAKKSDKKSDKKSR